VGVRRGIEESQPARIARRKVDKTGEPKERWVYRTNSASERLWILGTVGKREREDRMARKSGVTHVTGYTCRKSMRGHRGRKSKSRQRRRSNWLNKIIIFTGKIV
jgi:hypothetical protein